MAKKNKLFRKLFGLGSVTLTTVSFVAVAVVSCGQGVDLKVRNFNVDKLGVVQLQYNIPLIANRIKEIEKKQAEADHNKKATIAQKSNLQYQFYQIKFSFYQKVFTIFQKYPTMKGAELWNLHPKPDEKAIPNTNTSIEEIFSKYFGLENYPDIIWNAPTKWKETIKPDMVWTYENALKLMKTLSKAQQAEAYDAYLVKLGGWNNLTSDDQKKLAKELVPDLQHAVMYNLMFQLLLV